MANIVLTVASNWSTCSDGTNTGSAPGATDNIYLNGYALNLDGADASTYTCALIKACASNGTTMTAGSITLANTTSTIAANIQAGSADLITLAGGKTLTVNGTVTGGSSTNKEGIRITGGTNTLSVTNATGGSANGAIGISLEDGTNTFSISGTATGGSALSAHGINNWSNITVTVPSAVGGSLAGAHGVSQGSGDGAITVTSATGGSALGACGAVAVYGTIILNGTVLTGTGYPAGASGGILKVAAGVHLQFSNAAGALRKFYNADAGQVLTAGGGTYVTPVQAGYSALATAYGADSGTTGTLAAAKIMDVTYGTLAASNVLTAGGGTFDEAARNVDPGVANVLAPGSGGPAHYHVAGATLTGTYNIPAQANVVKTGTAFYGVTGSLIDGLFDEAARNTDPGEAYVISGHDYKILNVSKTAGYTGTGTGGGRKAV